VLAIRPQQPFAVTYSSLTVGFCCSTRCETHWHDGCWCWCHHQVVLLLLLLLLLLCVFLGFVVVVAISVPGAAPSPRAARLATATGTGLDGQLVFGEARRVLDPGQELFGDAPNEITNSQPAAISDANAFEFGVRGVQNQWFVHFTSQGRVTLTLVVDAIITSIVNTFRSEAFVGLGPLQEVSNNASVTATFMNDTLTVSQRLTWPVLRVGPAGTVVLYQAVYELYSQCVPGPLAPCCHTNGTFKTGDVCR